MYPLALRFIKEHTILEINMKSLVVSAEEVLAYFYYAGMCYISCKDYKSAMYYFAEVLLMPSEHVSMIAVDALKKLMLLSLIVNGKQFTPPE